MTQAPRTADRRPGLAEEAAGADDLAAPMEPLSVAGAGTPGDAEGDPERENGFGDLKHNLTNHWTVQDR
jgi:hypothetical protein